MDGSRTDSHVFPLRLICIAGSLIMDYTITMAAISFLASSFESVRARSCTSCRFPIRSVSCVQLRLGHLVNIFLRTCSWNSSIWLCLQDRAHSRVPLAYLFYSSSELDIESRRVTFRMEDRTLHGIRIPDTPIPPEIRHDTDSGH